jgi:coenzyme F420-reducing hydrogenase alpha subunit
MTIEGDLSVRLDWDGRRVRRASVRSTRPLAASRVLSGRAPAAAVAMVPLLYSICGRAQGAAAACATEAALGVTPSPQDLAAHELAVVLETIQEYLWRMLIDWPDAIGRDGVTEPVAVARQRIAAFGAAGVDGRGIADASARVVLATDLANVAAQHVYGAAPAAWLARMDVDAFDAWARDSSTLPAALLAELFRTAPTLGQSDVGLMPAPRREALRASVLPALRATPDFEHAPDWEGAPVETGALARVHAHTLVAALRARWGNAVPVRMAARLVELAALLGWLHGTHADGGTVPWVDAFAPAPGEGVAAVQTARGLLLHRVLITGGLVAGYQIIAPTEWNFHPDGALTRGLVGLPAADEATLSRQARLAVQALDPCVACNVEVAHA